MTPTLVIGGRLPAWLWPLFIVLALLGIRTTNPALTFAGLLVMPLLLSLLWRPGEPPILLFCCLMQWLQIVTPVLNANLAGETLEGISGLPTHDRATWLSLLGVVVMACGMRLALRWRFPSGALQMMWELGRLNVLRVFCAYLVAFGVNMVCGVIAWKFGGLVQLILAAGCLKWALLWLLFCSAFTQRTGLMLVGVAVLIEASSGLLGFFASFKEGIFLLVLALFSIRSKLSLAVRLGSIVAMAGLLCLMIFWQSVKMDYRRFLNDGAGGHTVTLPIESRVEKLGELAGSLDSGAIQTGAESLVERVGYTELFAATLAWVPANEPYARGELWKGAILHPLMPRLLFPNKPEMDDSERARRFTGRKLSGREENTSIGIGYMAESYVDFGKTLMFVPILLLGYLLGHLYRAFCLSGESRAWGAALAVAALVVSLQAFAMTGAKLLGSVVTTSLVLYLLNRLAGRTIVAWIRWEPAYSFDTSAINER